MNFAKTDEQRALRDTLVDFARKELNGDIIARDRSGTFPRACWDAAGTQRLQGLPVPEELGGCGLDPLSTALAMEALGYGCRDGGLVFAIGAHLFACVVPLWKFGSDAQRRRYLPDLCAGRLIAANGMTESSGGSDAFTMSTRAEKTPGGYRINGRKTYCSNGEVADLAVIYAETEPGRGYHGGITAFILERGTPGFHIGQTFEKMGLRSSPMNELVLDDVQVSDEAVLGTPGGGGVIFSASMDWERIGLSAGTLGTLERLLETALGQARSRKTFGQAIGKFQGVSFPIADMKVALEASRLLTYKAASRLDTSREVALDASIAKLFVSESLVRSAQATLQILGGAGYLTECEVERVVRDGWRLPSILELLKYSAPS